MNDPYTSLLGSRLRKRGTSDDDDIVKESWLGVGTRRTMTYLPGLRRSQLLDQTELNQILISWVKEKI